MALYSELRVLANDSDLTEKCEVAVAVAAHTLATGSPTADDQAWIGSVLGNPGREARKALYFILADNKDATVAQITGATDATLQGKVDLVIPSLVAAYAAERASGGSA